MDEVEDGSQEESSTGMISSPDVGTSKSITSPSQCDEPMDFEESGTDPNISEPILNLSGEADLQTATNVQDNYPDDPDADSLDLEKPVTPGTPVSAEVPLSPEPAAFEPTTATKDPDSASEDGEVYDQVDAPLSPDAEVYDRQIVSEASGNESPISSEDEGEIVDTSGGDGDGPEADVSMVPSSPVKNVEDSARDAQLMPGNGPTSPVSEGDFTDTESSDGELIDDDVKTNMDDHLDLTEPISPAQDGDFGDDEDNEKHSGKQDQRRLSKASLHDDHGELDYDEDEDEQVADRRASTTDDKREEGEIREEGEESDTDTDGELEDECEEGEIQDNSPQKGDFQRPVCRFFLRSQCTWGNNCRFEHPGVTDRGNYQLIERPGMGPAPKDQPDNKSEREDDLLPPPPEQPAQETAWERGLRQAKELRKKASKRKETEPDFEEKRQTLKPEEDHDIEREKDRIRYMREREYYENPTFDEEEGLYATRITEGWQEDTYDNFEVRCHRDPADFPGFRDFPRENLRERHEEFPQRMEPPQRPPAFRGDSRSFPDFRIPPHERSRHVPGRGRGGRGRGWGNDKYGGAGDRFEGGFDKGSGGGGRPERFGSGADRFEKGGPDQDPDKPPAKNRGDQWADPWMRSKSPPRKNKSASRSPSRGGRRHRSGSFSSSYSSSSYSSRSRSRSRSLSRSSYSSYSSRSSYSRSRSRSRSPSVPKKRLPFAANVQEKRIHRKSSGHHDVPRSAVSRIGPGAGRGLDRRRDGMDTERPPGGPMNRGKGRGYGGYDNAGPGQGGRGRGNGPAGVSRGRGNMPPRGRGMQGPGGRGFGERNPPMDPGMSKMSPHDIRGTKDSPLDVKRGRNSPSVMGGKAFGGGRGPDPATTGRSGMDRPVVKNAPPSKPPVSKPPQKPLPGRGRPMEKMLKRKAANRSFSSSSSRSRSASFSSRSRSRSYSASSRSSRSNSSSSSSSSASADSEHLYRNMGRHSSPSPSPRKHKKMSEKPGAKVPMRDLGSSKPSAGRPMSSRDKGGENHSRLGTSGVPALPQSGQDTKDLLKMQGQKSNIKLTLKSDKDPPVAKKRTAVPLEPTQPQPPVKKPRPDPVRMTIRSVDKPLKLPPLSPKMKETPPAPVVVAPPPAPAPPPTPPPAPKITKPVKTGDTPKKKSSSSTRREELLKQLKAVEDAIMRKRTKIN